MTNKIQKPTGNGGVLTPTANPTSKALCGIPKVAPKGSNNTVLKLNPKAADIIAALDKPLAPQAQNILYNLDQMGGTATKGELMKRLEDKQLSGLVTTQSVDAVFGHYSRMYYDRKLLLS